MRTRWISTVSAIATLSLAMPVFAQDEEGEMPADPMEEPAADTSGGEEPAATEDTGGGEAAMTDDAGGGAWPGAEVERPLVLNPGMLQINANVQINLSSDLVGKPVSIAPDIYYGVNDKLTIGLVHTRGAVPLANTNSHGTGIGDGICITGEENGCGEVYDNVGIDALFSLIGQGEGALQLAAHGGLVVGGFDPFLLGLRAGVRGKFTSGQLAVIFDPQIQIGLTERDFNKEVINIPVAVQFQATPQLAAFVGTGITGPLDGFGDAYFVPVNLGAAFNVSPMLDVGAQFGLPAVVNGLDIDAFDFRTLTLFGNIRI